MWYFYSQFTEILHFKIVQGFSPPRVISTNFIKLSHRSPDTSVVTALLLLSNSCNGTQVRYMSWESPLYSRLTPEKRSSRWRNKCKEMTRNSLMCREFSIQLNYSWHWLKRKQENTKLLFRSPFLATSVDGIGWWNLVGRFRIGGTKWNFIGANARI